MKSNIFEIVKYAFWGGVSTGINLVVFYLLLKTSIPYIVGNVLSYAVAVAASYFFNEYLVFGKDEKNDHQTEPEKASHQRNYRWIKYVFIRVLSIAVDSALLAFLHEICNLNLTISKIVDSVIIIMATYILSKYWVFKK